MDYNMHWWWYIIVGVVLESILLALLSFLRRMRDRNTRPSESLRHDEPYLRECIRKPKRQGVQRPSALTGMRVNTVTRGLRKLDSKIGNFSKQS